MTRTPLVRPRKTVSQPLAAPARATRPSPVAAPAKTTARVFALDVPFEYRAVAQAGGARWDEDEKAFLYRGEALPPSLVPFAAEPYSLEARLEARLNGTKRVAKRGAGQIVLRAHQVTAVERIVAAHAAGLGGFLLADDVGLGKTITTWEAVTRLGADTVLVVCPLAVVAHWRRTIAAMGDGGRDVVVMNYDRLGKLFEVDPAKKAKVKSKKGLARAGQAPDFDVVVWDESHRLKNPAAARSKFAAKLTANAGFALWLSATAGQNPLELSYLAPLLARATGQKASDLKDFEKWCADFGLGLSRGSYGRWDWRGDPADCDKVHALLFGATGARAVPGIRRRPEDIAGWPELNRVLTPIGLEGAARALYEEAWVAFRKELSLAPKGKNPTSALAATLRLRQKGSLLRAPGTVELVRELLDNGHQVAISVAFTETLEALATALAADFGAAGSDKIAKVHGKIPAAQREAERLRFQRGEAPICLFTVEEGISLHQGEHNEVPRSLVIHDLRWSAIQMAQIEGRCHRDGRYAVAYWAFAEHTIEAQIAEVVCRRIGNMKAMVGDDVETLREIEELLREPGH